MSIREPLQTATNLSGSITVTLYRCILGSFDVLVHTHTEDAEALVADADDWIYSDIERAQVCFDQLVTKYQWHGCGSAPAQVSPVTVGLTVDTMQTYRNILSYGMPFEMVMKHLERIFKANKALSERGLDWMDNIYQGHALK